jgi:hypothetical protein
VLTDCGDFSFFDNQLKTLTDAVRKNQTRIGKDHLAKA